MTKSTVVSMLMASGLLVGCSMDTTGMPEDEAVGEVTAELVAWDCGRKLVNGSYTWDYNGLKQNRKYEMEAALAVSAIADFGRLEPQLDLAIAKMGQWSEKLVITSEGLARCAARGVSGCPQVAAHLYMQDNANSGDNSLPAPGSGLEVMAFRDLIVAHYKTYMAAFNQSGNVCKGFVVGDLTYDRETPGVCAQYGVTDSKFRWYKANDPTKAGKLWCKGIAFGGPQALGQPPANFYMTYQSDGTSEAFDPAPETPVIFTGAQANQNVAKMIGNGQANFSYTRPETGSLLYTHHTAGTGMLSVGPATNLSPVPLGQECWADGVKKYYRPHPALAAVYQLCY
jgi:hypothetical protein